MLHQINIFVIDIMHLVSPAGNKQSCHFIAADQRRHNHTCQRLKLQAFHPLGIVPVIFNVQCFATAVDLAAHPQSDWNALICQRCKQTLTQADAKTVLPFVKQSNIPVWRLEQFKGIAKNDRQ